MMVLGMLAWLAAAVSLWLGARRYEAAVGRGYRWLAAGAALYCAGLVVQGILGGTLNPAPGLSFTDLPQLLALAAVAIGIAVLTMAEREISATPQEGSAGSVLPGLADGYVMAVALLVIGWSTLFSAEFHRSGERPGTFLLALIHPLADLAVLGALLPMVTTAWRRVMLPYLSLVAIAVGDALAVGQRVLGGHLGVAGQLMPVVAAALLGVAPWRMTEGFGASWTRRTTSTAATTVIAVAAASVATLVVIANGLADAPASGIALIVAAPGCSRWPRGSSCWCGRTWPCSASGASPAAACATWPAGPAMWSWSATWTARSGTRARRSRTTATRPRR
jgi:hypothetical protein